MVGLAFACQNPESRNGYVVTADIDNFWAAYDIIVKEPDSLKQLVLLDSLYIKKGTKGLAKIIAARNYTTLEYINLINQYPKYWNSIRDNTLRSKDLESELNAGIEKLRSIYPELKPARIYFTIGAMRTSGTVQDSLVLIGSELAMGDNKTDISEFEGNTKEWLEGYFGTNPLNSVVLLNVHEYVHTQQNPMPEDLLHIVLWEGVAEFVSVTAMGLPSSTPAIEYGKNNPEVREKFEAEMFFERTFDWLWSNSPNEFGVRDLGYYIGYAIAEMHYEKSKNKLEAIRELVELDYSDPVKIDSFIDETGYFSKPIDELRQEDLEHRPRVLNLTPFENNSDNVDPGTKRITVEFSEKLNGYNTGVDYSDMNESGFPDISNRFWSADSTSFTLEVDLEPRKHYKFWITSNFRTVNDIPLVPYLIDFETGEK